MGVSEQDPRRSDLQLTSSGSFAVFGSANFQSPMYTEGCPEHPHGKRSDIGIDADTFRWSGRGFAPRSLQIVPR